MRILLTACLGLILCFNVACRRDANVSIPESNQDMVLQSFIKADSPARVHLSKSRSILEESGLDPVTNADVILRENGATVQNLNHVKKGLYQSKAFKAKAGNNYKVVVKRPGKSNVVGSANLPKPVDIESTEIIRKGYTTRDGQKKHKLTVTVDDPAGVNNYYELLFRNKLYDSSQNENEYYPISLSSDDPAVDAQSMQGQLLDDNFFNGETYTLTFYLELNGDLDETGGQGQKQVVLRTVSKAYYEYERKLFKQKNSFGSAGVFSGEPVYIYDNIDNGLGVCAGYSQVVDAF